MFHAAATRQLLAKTTARLYFNGQIGRVPAPAVVCQPSARYIADHNVKSIGWQSVYLCLVAQGKSALAAREEFRAHR